MTPAVVLDASALVALVSGERSSAVVAQHVEESQTHLSTVTLPGATGKLRRLGVDVGRLGELLVAAQVGIAPFTALDAGQALRAQALDDARLEGFPVDAPAHHRKRLSLGDRCCLALALRLGLPALTGDYVWADLGEPVQVSCFADAHAARGAGADRRAAPSTCPSPGWSSRRSAAEGAPGIAVSLAG